MKLMSKHLYLHITLFHQHGTIVLPRDLYRSQYLDIVILVLHPLPFFLRSSLAIEQGQD